MDPFYLQPAPHAFPSPFPPCCEYNSILSQPHAVHLETRWPRCPSQHRSMATSSDSVNSLTYSLAGLILEDAEHSQSSTSVPLSLNRGKVSQESPACFPTAIYPPSAPLPALVSTVVDIPHAHVTTPHDAAPIKRRGSRKSPAIACARSQRSTRISSSLPLRVPKSVPKLVREYAHPYTDRSATRSKVKRLSSSSSLSSISSNCSSSSSLDSPLSTPPSSPKALALQPKSSFLYLPFEPAMHNLDDCQIPRVSLDEGLQMNWGAY